MFPYPFLEAAYMAKMSGGGKVKPITITENGTYNVSDAEKAEGNVGFSPVTVDVQAAANIQPLTVVEPGVYNASDYGCDGFDPVNVSDKYKKLYEYATGGVCDNTTDDGHNVPNSLGSGDTENTNEYLDLSSGEFDTVTNSGNSLQNSIYFDATTHPTHAKYWTLAPMWKAVNLSNGEISTGRAFSTDVGWNEATTKKPFYRIKSIEYDISITKVHIDLTRYWESGTERDTWSNTLTFDHNSYGVGQFTDSWFISSSQ